MSNWIKCSEQMPPFEQWVLVRVPWFPRPLVAFRLGANINGDFWRFEGFSMEHCIAALWPEKNFDYTVTHWQPLPEPPND